MSICVTMMGESRVLSPLLTLRWPRGGMFQNISEHRVLLDLYREERLGWDYICLGGQGGFPLLPSCHGDGSLPLKFLALLRPQVLRGQSAEGQEPLRHWSGRSHTLLQPKHGPRRVSVSLALLGYSEWLYVSGRSLSGVMCVELHI